MASLDSLPFELCHMIVECCPTRSLPAMALVSRRFSPAAQAKLFRHIYFRQTGSTDTDHNGNRRWCCGDCGKSCNDNVFTDEVVLPLSTQCQDLQRFARAIASSQSLVRHVRTLRLDVQSQAIWSRPLALGWPEIPDDNDIEQREERRWFQASSDLNQPAEGAAAFRTTLDAVTEACKHLGWTRAYFASTCTEYHNNPRFVQTMGMPAPFTCIVPHFAIDPDNPQNPGYVVYEEDEYDEQNDQDDGAEPDVQVNENDTPAAEERLHRFANIEMTVEWMREYRLDCSSTPPKLVQATRWDPDRQSMIWDYSSNSMTLVRYIGRWASLAHIFGAPLDFDSCLDWLEEEPGPEESYPTIRSIFMRKFEFYINLVGGDPDEEAPDNADVGLYGNLACLRWLRPTTSTHSNNEGEQAAHNDLFVA